MCTNPVVQVRDSVLRKLPQDTPVEFGDTVITRLYGNEYIVYRHGRLSMAEEERLAQFVASWLLRQ